MEREVYGQSYSGRYSDGLENIQLPAEQYKHSDRDEDGGDDTEHGEEGEADNEWHALSDTSLPCVEVEHDEPAETHLFWRHQHSLAHPDVIIEGGENI